MTKRNSKKIIFFLPIFIFVLPSCLQQRDKKTYNAKLSFQYLILEKTNLQLDTNSFTINLDSVKHTEGAFDSDYCWFIKSQFDKISFEKIKQNIRTTIGFCTVGAYEQFYNEKWAKIDTSKIKGVWTIDSVFIKFIEKPIAFRGEILQFSLDTLTQQANVELIHL
jgi:hypothetical protein